MYSIPKTAPLVLAAALAAPAIAQPAAAPWNPDPSITASLDIGGSGNFTGVIDKGQMCYMINAAGIAGATGAEIVSTKPDKSGQVLLQLQAPVGGAGAGCMPVTADVANRLIKNAGNFALKIDSAMYPAGAVMAPLMSENG